MGSGRPLFRLFGVPVRVQPAFFVVILLLGIVYPPEFLVSWIVIATVSILLHEMGHAAAFRAFGMQPSVTLQGLGGLTTAALPGPRPDGRPSFTPGQRVVVSLAGPLSALVLLGLPALVLSASNGFEPLAALGYSGVRSGAIDPAEMILSQIIWINVGWSLLNLLPMLPLDGGNVMLAVAEAVRPRNARQITNAVSLGVAGVGAVLCLAAGQPFLILLLVLLGGVNVLELVRSGEVDDTDELADVHRLLLAYQPAEAERAAWAVLSRQPDPAVRRAATELVAWARLARGDLRGAGDAVAALTPGGPSPSLRGALALAAGNRPEGVAVTTWALVNDPDAGTRTLAAIAAAQTGAIPAVAHELAALGPAGSAALRWLAGILAQAGFAADADHVHRVLSSATPA